MVHRSDGRVDATSVSTARTSYSFIARNWNGDLRDKCGAIIEAHSDESRVGSASFRRNLMPH